MLFMVVGPLLLLANVFTDMIWFVLHLYKMDLDKSITKKTKAEEVAELPEIHRRTYKAMLKYFGKQNDQLVLQRHVAEDLRKKLDIDEGIRCLLFGKPIMIPEGKQDFYLAYSKIYEQDDKSDWEKAESAPQQSFC